MNDITNYQAQLPDTFEDLSQFVLVNEERIQALRAQIRAIKKVHLAKEVYEQKLAEAQEIGQITVEAAQKMGELLLQIQKQSGKRTDLETSTTGIAEVKTKSEITSDMGMTRNQVNQYQQMAQNPDAVQAAIQKAIENGDVVSRNQVMKEIRSAKAEARAELERQLAEKNRRISELENREPKVETKEVFPDDYEELKQSVERQKKEAIAVQKERKKEQAKRKELEQRIRDLESREDIDALEKKVREEAGYFAIRTYNYIQQNGGCVWIFEKIDELPEKEMKNFIDAIYAADAFIKQMVENIGGYGLNE